MTQPGHRLHNLSEMQLMSQNAAQRAATRTQVLETTLIALQKRVEQAEKHLLGILDALQQQQEAERQIAEAHEGLMVRLQALENPPKRKPGRPKGSTNKPKAQTVVVKPIVEKDENTALSGDSSNSGASEASDDG